MDFTFENCQVVRWVDGDTVDLQVDLGFHISTQQRFRLANVNTPEKKMPGYKEAIEFVSKEAPTGSTVKVHCHGYDRYGRWIATLTRESENSSINQKLLDNKLAAEYK